MIYYYFKRNKYLEVKSNGRNNRGRITIRGKQKNITERKSFIFKGFKYINLQIIIRFLYFYSFFTFKVINKVSNRISGITDCIVTFSDILFKNIYLCLPSSNKIIKGSNILVGDHEFLNEGNIMYLRNTSIGITIHNINFKNNFYIRKSGKNSYVINKGQNYVTVKMPSGKFKLISKNAYCIVGKLEFNMIIGIQKAGDNRRLGNRPKVRGVAMNACDHPHGGGEGKSSIGRKSIFSI